MIKKLLLRILVTSVAVVAMIYLIPGLAFFGGIIDYLMVVGIFFVANFLTRPITRILFLPVEIATLGLISIALNASVIYLLPFIVLPLAVKLWLMLFD